MKIAFFEISESESTYFKKYLSKHKLKFFAEPLSLDNIYQISDFDIVSVFIYSKIDASVLQKLPKLKFISTRSMGFDHVSLSNCSKRGIKLSNTPHYGDNSVAEHTFALILSLSRNIHKAYLRNLSEDHSIEGLQGFDLKGKTIGVIGTGRIGSKVIQIAKGFEMSVLACDRHPDKAFAKKHHFKYESLSEVLKKSDIISLHIPYCAENHHLINASALKLMKSSAFLINTSRGAIVDTSALMSALNNNRIAGAGLDVIEGEELIKEEKELLHSKKLNVKKMNQLSLDHRILRNEKVVFTPHIAFYSSEALKRIMEVTIENINAFAKGKAINLVN